MTTKKLFISRSFVESCCLCKYYIDSGNDIRLTQLVVICLTFPRNKTGKARLKFSMFERDVFFFQSVTQAGSANRSQSYDALVTRPDALPISYR